MQIISQFIIYVNYLRCITLQHENMVNYIKKEKVHSYNHLLSGLADVWSGCSENFEGWLAMSNLFNLLHS